MSAFQAENAGSSPAARTKKLLYRYVFLIMMIFGKRDWACAGVGEPGQTVNLLAYA